MTFGPLLLATGPALIAAIAYLTRRWPYHSSLFAAAALSGMSLALGFLGPKSGPGGVVTVESMAILGRSAALTEQVRLVALIVIPAVALLSLLSAMIPQGSAFVTVSSGMLSPLFIVIMISPSTFGIILLMVMAPFMAILIQGERPGATLSAVRFLSLLVMAAMALLVSGWMAESRQASYIPAMTALYLMAFTILLASFPFHVWIPTVLSESRALIPAVIGAAQLLVVVFCLRLIQDAPVVKASLFFSQFMRASGLISAMLAGLLALNAPSFGTLLGYVLMLDLGVGAISFSFTGPDGLEVTILSALLRLVGLILAGLGLGMLRQRPGWGRESGSMLRRGQGWYTTTPAGVLLFAYGAASLVGLPLTPGFAGRWAVGAMLAQRSTWQALALVGAVGLCTAGLARGIGALLQDGQPHSHEDGRERRFLPVLAGVLLVAGFVLSLFPQIIMPLAANLANSL